jgi:hypothetical protein
MASEVENKRHTLQDFKKETSVTVRDFIEQWNVKRLNFEEVGGTLTQLEYSRMFISALVQNDHSWKSFELSVDTRDTIQLNVLDANTNEVKSHDVKNPLALENLFTQLKEADNRNHHESKAKGKPTKGTSNEAYYNNMEKQLTKAKTFEASKCCGNCGGLGHTWDNCTSGRRDSKVLKITMAKKDNSTKPKFNQEKPRFGGYTELNEENWMATTTNQSENRILLDGGCTTSMFNSKKYFTDLRDIEPVTFTTMSENMEGNVFDQILHMNVLDM